MSEKKPIMHMLTRGPRALTNTWSKVTIYADEEKDAIVAEREEAEAPADGYPIFVPGLGNISMEMADYILEAQRHRSRERAARPRPNPVEVAQEVNRMWLDYIEQKLRWFKGQTTVGPGGLFQRERSPDRHG